MNVVFLTMPRFSDINVRGIYQDLMRKIRDEGHNVYVVTSHERSLKLPTEVVDNNGIKILGVKTLNLQKTNVIEKGIGQVLLEWQFKRAIKKYLGNIQFDLITYTTPPITFTNVIQYLKRKNPNAITYLQLKDIFPQNAVDLGMLSTRGIKGLLYLFFRNKEKRLYSISDYIGCMSPANVSYVLRHNPEVSSDQIEVAPNSLEVLQDYSSSDEKVGYWDKKSFYRRKFNLPVEGTIFLYGGNLGKPQGIPYIIECLDANINRQDCFFVIIGSGTEFPHIIQWHKRKKPQNVVLLNGLPKAEYDKLVRACDVGLIFLDHRFTIPNYPSRLLSYLENKMPVLCATDPNTDIGKIAEENGYGYWCESNSVEAFTANLDKMIRADKKVMGEKGYEFMKENYLVENTYNVIMSHFPCNS